MKVKRLGIGLLSTCIIASGQCLSGAYAAEPEPVECGKDKTQTVYLSEGDLEHASEVFPLGREFDPEDCATMVRSLLRDLNRPMPLCDFESCDYGGCVDKAKCLPTDVTKGGLFFHQNGKFIVYAHSGKVTIKLTCSECKYPDCDKN